MSTEGKARIAAAQKKRWAKVKRAAAANVPHAKPLISEKRTGTKNAKKFASRSHGRKVAAKRNGVRSKAKKISSNVVKHSVKPTPEQPSGSE